MVTDFNSRSTETAKKSYVVHKNVFKITIFKMRTHRLKKC